jgi:pyridinium-3,5-biscarboxylic acid mononucleotide sulfurtransferase
MTEFVSQPAPTGKAQMLARLEAVVDGMDRVAVAVSGGVDSLTLAHIAALTVGDRAMMHHATSPAVPQAATERTISLAQTYGWQLDIFDAGEFADANYLANPINRCFFCKTNLYGAIADRTTAQILSGTNLDDLGEYRPGLDAARAHGVRHPFVEAGIGKAAVRELSTALGMGEIAELPAAPCLASRVETGIGIDPKMLSLIDSVERWLRDALRPRTVRCRVRASGIVVELDKEALESLGESTRAAVQQKLANKAADHGFPVPVSFAPYRTGSAFVARAT